MDNDHNANTTAVYYVIQNEKPASDAVSSSDLVAMTSAFIALLALFATIYSSLLQRKHNRLSSKPALNTVIDEPNRSIYLANHGLGPAFLVQAEAVLDGKVYNLLIEKESDAFSNQLCDGISSDTEYNWMILERNAAIAAGAEQIMLKLRSDSDSEWKAIHEAIDRTSIKITYESVYKEKAVTTHLGSKV